MQPGSPLLRRPISPQSSAVSLVEQEKDFKEGVRHLRESIDALIQLRESLTEKLAESQRVIRSSGEQIAGYMGSPCIPLKGDVERLRRGNDESFRAEVGLNECAEGFRTGIKDLNEKVEALATVHLQTELQLVKYGYEIRLQKIIMEDPLALKGLASKAEFLCTDLQIIVTADHLETVEDASLAEWNRQFTPLKEEQARFLNNAPNSTERVINTLVKELDLFIRDDAQMNKRDFTLLTDSVPPAVEQEWKTSTDNYKQKCQKTKEKCVEFWNQSLGSLVTIEVKLLLIRDCKRHEPTLQEWGKKFADFKKNLEALRHNFKGKSKDQTFRENRAHLAEQFEPMKELFSEFLSNWKQIRAQVNDSLKFYEDKQKAYEELGKTGLATPDHPIEAFNASYGSILEINVKGWIATVKMKFQSYLTAISADVNECAFWMDVTDCVVRNPGWKYTGSNGMTTLFPNRTLFTSNHLGYYTPYTKYRDLIKG